MRENATRRCPVVLAGCVVIFGIPYQYTLSHVLRARLVYLRDTFAIREQVRNDCWWPMLLHTHVHAVSLHPRTARPRSSAGLPDI